METIYHEEGRVVPNSSGEYFYDFIIRDHLGNTRVMFRDINSDGLITESEILSESNYYPGGLEMEGQWNQQTNPEQNYLFTGLERQHDYGLNLDMAQFRTFDFTSCRWLQIDPLASEMTAWSPYNYGFDNPIKYTDPDGLNPIIPWALRKVVWEGLKQIGRTIFTPAKPPSQYPGPITVAPPRGATVIDRNVTVARELARQAEMMEGLAIAPETITSNVTKDTGGLGDEAIVKSSDSVERVGRWMSVEEYDNMKETGVIQEGSGGLTFVANSGPNSFKSQAKSGSVYAEFDVNKSSLLQGGKEDWFKAVGPNAGRAMKFKFKKQGGEISPKVKNISDIIDTK